MRNRPILLVALVSSSAWALTTSTPAAGAADAGPGRFLAGLYAHYPVAGKARPFDPVGRSASQVFDGPLVALIRRDQHAARGEVGALDGDPLCDCQDDAGMTWTIAKIVAQGSGKAVAEVRLSFPDRPKPRIDRLTVALVKTAAGWRIHDIGSASTPSLQGLLRPAPPARRDRSEAG